MLLDFSSFFVLYLLCVNIGHLGYKECNNYLKDEKSYNKLRNRLASANITFKNANANNLHNEFKGEYDIILLSNILDYFFKYWGNNWEYDKLLSYEKQLENICKNDAIIFLHYNLYMAQINPTTFGESNIKIEDLKNEEVLRLGHDHGGVPTGIVLKRIKKGI